ncbi:RING finger protein 223 [Dunckerocampus dactyliophorus]|uniref:RING finger protein 223 n=1 Tax=Dunckerocampus dactyliophorus TaxID=161453 RepID=UPI00240534C1|nr:RING finger protein 223 [Dunckerocampus dactyliophorus]XP_054646020.1 RING finger protein 223 [Dunckerocampus dactyliophorus]
MDQLPQVWHMQGAGQEPGGDPQKKMSTVSQLECPICYNTYDNVFKTPKLLACSHTFCLECLSRLMAISPAEHDIMAAETGEAGTTPHVFCPFCRQSTALPDGGPPSLPTNHDMLHKLPSHQQQEEPVWLEGEKLCYKSSRPASDSLSALCVCIDIGATKVASGAPIRSPPHSVGLLHQLADWKRMVLFVMLMVLLVVVVLWPLQCMFSTGNMRCMQMVRPNRTATTPTMRVFNQLTRPPALTQ